MRNRWVKEFYDLANSKGKQCRILCRSRGWIETIDFGGKDYYTKSVTYNLLRRQFFVGVDPSKLNDTGDFVLICGSKGNDLSNIFIIPWSVFFVTLEKGRPINSYKPPKEYFQYKLYLRDREGPWLMSVQGGDRPILDVSQWHYNVDEALAFIYSI